MASTFTRINNALGVDSMRDGTKVRFCNMSVKNADYSSGFAITALSVGFNTIFGVSCYGVKNGAGTPLPLVWTSWDFVNGKLRVGDATSEADAAAQITDGSVFRLRIEGV